ncbi:MAG TPA: ferritin-like domain-containing protein [Candidatus Limnocylindrales bacterium]|nr:ferritin-like domain-containing protein [Candidatus Limnocylindrales bacterium]
MQYTQRNPLPLPPSGASETVPSEINTVFDWEYALGREKLMALYEKGKASTWNATDIDWSIKVDLDAFIRQRVDMGVHHMVNALLAPPQPLEPEQLIEMNLNTNAWMLSQFLHGEQGALLATAKIVLSAPLEEAKFYAANQVADEARHVEVYHRYLTEKLGRSFEVNRHLQILLDQILSDSRWDMTYLGMQIMVEGLALAAFGLMKVQMPDEPLIQDITSRIMQDESRHVAFGVLSLEDIYRNQLTSAELREREDFVIEATYLMRDRLLMEQVYERMGWDVDLWVGWAKTTPYMTGFRRMLFSKIVPNLRRLGLLTPRVRDAYEQIGILEFADMKDSTEDPDVMPPEELVRLIQQFQSAGATTAAAS